MTRTLVMLGILHYLWLSFGNSPYALVMTNIYGQPEILGGINSGTEDRSALTVGPTARSRTGCSNDFVNVLVDSGTSGHYFDDAIIAGLRNRLEEYKVLDAPRKSQPPGGEDWRHYAGSAPGPHHRRQSSAAFTPTLCLIVPGIGRNLFSVKQAAPNGVVSILGMNSPPKLEVSKRTLTL